MSIERGVSNYFHSLDPDTRVLYVFFSVVLIE